MRTKVKSIRTHQVVFVEGWGDLKNIIPGQSKTFPGLQMTRYAEGVEVSATGKRPFLVPWGNIVLAELFDEDKAQK